MSAVQGSLITEGIEPLYADRKLLGVITCPYMPSVNDALFAYNAGRHAGNSFTDKWQAYGRKKVVRFASDHELRVEEYQHPKLDKEGNVKTFEARERLVRLFLTEPVEVVLRVWRPTLSAYDVHNPYVKPIFDGYTQARLWQDDSVKYVLDVRMRHEGVDRSLVMPDEDRYARKRRQQVRKARSKTPVRFPMFGRFRFEFYSLTV